MEENDQEIESAGDETAGEEPASSEQSAQAGLNGDEPAADQAEIMVSVPYDEYEDMQQELQALRVKVQENLDGWQRALADYSNLKRRVEKERSEMQHNAIGSVIKPFLDVLDDLEIALRNRPADPAGKAWADGIEHVHRKLLGRLQAQGVEMMKAEGEAFDPFYHEAIGQDNSDEFESGQITHVLKPGYMIGERVLRPALVRVAE